MKIKVSHKLILILWASKFSKVIISLVMDMIQYSQSTQSNKFEISLQYLIREFRDGAHFVHLYKHQSFYKLALLFLMARHVQSSKNRKLEIFLQYIKKKCRNCFCVLLWCKVFRYFTRVQSCLLLLVPDNATKSRELHALNNIFRFIATSYC